LFALGHINDVALIKDDALRDPWSNRVRIEAYDVAHLSGKAMVGVMVVVVDGVPQKDEYRQFTIKSQKKSNDTGALREILVRRFKHNEWPLPDILLVDGASAQRNVALQVLDEYGLTIPVVALTKDEKHTPKKLQGEEGIVKAHATALILANHEAHRFSIRLHARKRDKEFIAKA
jgi:excinuclease ABC subunit C